jgi:hypothetical protein
MDDSAAPLSAEAAREARQEAQAAGKHNLARQFDERERQALAREIGEPGAADPDSLDTNGLPYGWGRAGLGPDEFRDAHQLATELVGADPELRDVFDLAVIEGPNGELEALGDSPVIHRALHRIAQALKSARSQSQPRRFAQPAEPSRAMSIEAQIAAIRAAKREAHFNGKTAEARRLDEQERALYARQPGGSAPIVGQSGRTR